MRADFVWLWLGFAACGGLAGLDGGDASDAASNVEEGGASVQTPDQIFDLSLWLDGDDPSTLEISDGGVVVWRDKSNCCMPTNAAQPYLPSPSDKITVNPTIANGHGALKIGPGLLSAPWGGAIVAFVAAYSNPKGSSAVVFADGANMRPLSHASFWMIGNWQGTSRVNAGNEYVNVTSTGDGYNDGRFHSFGMILGNSDLITIRIDGVETTSTNPRMGGASGGPIGGYLCPVPCNESVDGGWDGGYIIESPMDGYVAEIIASTLTPTNQQIAMLSAYFQKKYGVPF